MTLRTVGFSIALLGLYAAGMFGPSLARHLRPGVRDLPPSMLLRPTRRRDIAGAILNRARRVAPSPAGPALALAAGVVSLLISPLTNEPGVPGRPGDAGYLWHLSDELPDLLGSSLLFWALVPAGTLALALLVIRVGPFALPAAYIASFLLASLPVGLAYQKYFDPFVLIALALFARPGDLRERADYAGIALLAVAFVAYAFSFTG